MFSYMKSGLICLVVTSIALGSAGKFGRDDVPAVVNSEIDKQYVSYVHSLIEAYKEMMTEYEPPMETQYRTWKRNADLINSMLAMPKDMSDAGR